MDNLPILSIVIPCYNEGEVLPVTAPMFADELKRLISIGKISEGSFILFVDDGSADDTWEIICDYSKANDAVKGIRQSRNRGQQSALLAGLLEARELSDIVITTDCDGQNELAAMERMIDEYMAGSDIVYGVRKDRKSDGFFKRHSSSLFYKFVRLMGAEIIYNHADYRLVSRRVLDEFQDFEEVNIFLRGLFPLVGFKSSTVSYDVTKRLAGRTKYSTGKMMGFALDGITSFSIKPVRVFTILGFVVSIISIIGIIWTIIDYFCGNTVSGYASLMCVICFMAGIQLLGIGVIGEYIGKIYMEVKGRPRFIIAERTENLEKENQDK